MTITLRIQVERGALDGFSDRLTAALGRRLPTAIGDGLRAFVGRLQRDRLSGQGVATRTGALKRSFGVSVGGDLASGIAGTVTTTSKYFAIQEFGGTIRPVQAKFLAIPLDAAKTPAGVTLYPSPLRQSLPTAFPEGTFVRNHVLFGRKDGKAIALFALKKSVTLKPRIGMDSLWSSFASGTMEPLLRSAVEDAQAEAAGSGNR